jgi:two-component system, LytTR family, response regulator
MTNMKIFIVEDSRLARQELRTLLAVHIDCEIIGEAANVEAAIEGIETLRPDVLLLDIHLPGATGFDLLDKLDYLPIVIFATAYDHHALQAFERNALDYLLKPIAPERLRVALTRARERLQAQVPTSTAQQLVKKGIDDTIFVREGEQCWFVRLGDVSGFEVMGNYAHVWFDGKQPLLSRSLGYLEERLDPNLFFRASRSHLINLKWVASIQPAMSDGYLVKLRDGRTVEISRRQAKVLRETLEL